MYQMLLGNASAWLLLGFLDVMMHILGLFGSKVNKNAYKRPRMRYPLHHQQEFPSLHETNTTVNRISCSSTGDIFFGCVLI